MSIYNPTIVTFFNFGFRCFIFKTGSKIEIILILKKYVNRIEKVKISTIIDHLDLVCKKKNYTLVPERNC